MARPGISMKNTEKIPLGQEFWSPKKIPQKYRKNTKNAYFWHFVGIFSVFSGYFGGKFWSPEFRAGGIFSVFFVEIPGRAISGLCSRSGRSQLWVVFFLFCSGVFLGSAEVNSIWAKWGRFVIFAVLCLLSYGDTALKS